MIVTVNNGTAFLLSKIGCGARIDTTLLPPNLHEVLQENGRYRVRVVRTKGIPVTVVPVQLGEHERYLVAQYKESAARYSEAGMGSGICKYTFRALNLRYPRKTVTIRITVKKIS